MEYIKGKNYCVKMYLDYVNDFLTVARFAEYYGITEAEADEVIRIGRHNNEITGWDNVNLNKVQEVKL